MNHWVFTTDPVEIQVSGTGPFQIVYANPADDPELRRRMARRSAFVIASVAKQSERRVWIAASLALLAMTVGRRVRAIAASLRSSQ